MIHQDEDEDEDEEEEEEKKNTPASTLLKLRIQTGIQTNCFCCLNKHHDGTLARVF